ncbi:MAG: carboxymuconolactone decarboxylase family protein [Coriobacteriia bacterium]|nr:carboxymuconolactone decarboxylase family protein [Coriobacteriia bacterium]
MTIKQTAGRDQLGDFAPNFAHYNDDVLFGENWNSSGIDLKTRCLLTVTTLMAQGITDTSLAYHIQNAKAHGVAREELAAAITHVAFYAGWPKAWATFNLAKEVYADDAVPAAGGTADTAGSHGGFFGLGEPNDAYAQYFIGQSYLNQLSRPGDYLPIFNVTFEPGCRNNWHIHHASNGGGQVLICIDGFGWYQEEGKPAQALKSGDIVEIPANVKHWHGAKADSWFSHLAFEYPGEDASNEWCEPVDDAAYDALEG